MEYALIFAAAVAAYFIKGITGFGNTLVMATLVSFVLPNRIITPVELLISIPTNLFILWRERDSVDFKVVLPLAAMLIAGIIPGVFFLKSGNEYILKAVLGIVCAGLGVDMLLRQSDAMKKANKAVLATLGLGSGLLVGMYGIGMPLTAYVSRTTVGKNGFRANICAVFVIDNIVRCALFSATGMFTAEVWRYALMILPFMLLGMFIGVKTDKRLSDRAVKHIVALLLVFGGISLAITNIISYF